MKILIVDDSRAMRMIVMRHLRQAGFGNHTMVQAGNGVEAYNEIQSAPPDIVLCDWNMPEMNGIELLQKLRGEGNGIPFGFVTSEGSVEVRKLAMDSGAQFVISKPFTAESFEVALADHIG